MVSINYATKEVCCKIVYYGPGLSGKTTNLQIVHKKVPQDTRGKLISLATEADRTLYFDFLPINIGSINGFAAKFQLYTVPGQVYYNATRKLVLRGVDGVVFVADSQADKLDDNLESLSNLTENLQEYGYNVDDLPIVIQYNKSDLPSAMSVEELEAKLNSHGWPSYTASAFQGVGVFDTLKAIMKLVLEKAKSGGSRQKTKVRANPQAKTETITTESISTVAAAAPSTSPPLEPAAVAASSSEERKPASSVFGSARQTDTRQRRGSSGPIPTARVKLPSVTANQATGRIAPTEDSPTSTQPITRPTPRPSDSGGLPGAPGQGASLFGSRPVAVAEPESKMAETAKFSQRESAPHTPAQNDLAPAKPAVVVGRDPLEETPPQAPAKRGFFRRIFGMK